MQNEIVYCINCNVALVIDHEKELVYPKNNSQQYCYPNGYHELPEGEERYIARMWGYDENSHKEGVVY